MRLHFSDDEVQSGSATGFSDEHEGTFPTHPSHTYSTAVNFDPVTQILDKIDAELVSLTRSQGSNSTATTATDNTVVRRPNSRTSMESSRIENGDGLSISQLGPSYKPSVSLISSGSQQHTHSEQDTGIGTSSLLDSSLQHRSLGPDILPLEPGDGFKDDTSIGGHHSSAAPELFYLSGHHMSDDDKQRREKQTASTLEAKHVDDRFKEIMMKRKGGLLRNVDDDTQTIRTEDFVDKFKDTLVYSSAAGPGTPPIYPKPTHTSSLLRPSARLSFRVNPGHAGHASDADSVQTEDFERQFKGLLVSAGGKADESDLESVSNDPIHTRVKQLLKATAKYKPKPDHKSKPHADHKSKPHADHKSKPHVRISQRPVQVQYQDKGEDSDDTLCSEKNASITAYRSSENQSVQDEGIDETRRQIARESDKIRREMDQERRAKSPTRDRSPTRTYLTITQMPKTIYDKGDRPNATSGGKSLSDEEKEQSAEFKATHNALDVTQTALLEARKNLKGVQAQFEDVRTQLMLSEYKRDNSSKQLARLSGDLQRKHAEARNLDSQAQSRRDELKQFDAIGFTKEEAVQIIEENERMKGRIRNLDAIHAERDELVQQLDSTKQELFTEQKRARTHIEELKEEVETVTSTCEQFQTEKDETCKKLQKFEAGFKKMEKEKNELIHEKTHQYEEERDKFKSEKTEWRKRSLDEVEMLRHDLIRMTNKVAGLQDEVKAKEDLHLQLREQIFTLQQRYEHEKSNRGVILDEHKKNLQTLRKDTDTAMIQMRESLFLEKEKTVDMMREELDQERREIAARTEERYDAQVTELETIIKVKSDEISHLSKLAANLEIDLTRSKVKMDDDLKIQVQEAVQQERKRLVDERDYSVQHERDRLEREYRQRIKLIQDEMMRMKEEQKGLESRMKEQRHELEDLKNSNKTIVHEKLVAVARAKEVLRHEQSAEIDRVTGQLRNEHKKEVEQLKETVRAQEVEIRQLREDRAHYVRQQKERSLSLDKTERMLVNEINDECKKTSEMLGLNPRKVSLSSSLNNSGSTKTATTSALANLRACNEELRIHVTDLQHDLEVQRNSLNLADRNQDDALNTLKRQLEREKEEDMTRLKERLVRGLSANEYRNLLYTPDNEAATHQHYELKSTPNVRHLRQLSEQQQHDLERLEQEINRLTMTTGSGPLGHEDIDYAKRLAQLHSKVKQLHADNSNLRQAKLNVSSSSPNLTTPDLYSTSHNHRKFTTRSPSPTRDQQKMASNLELRMREHDYETSAMNHHQRSNRDIMSKKMAEMSKLQNTLTNQAKDLIQLEKAYTQLNQSAKSPRPSVR